MSRHLAMVCLFACGGARGTGASVDTECSGPVSLTAGSVVFARGKELVLRRLDASMHRVAFGGCLKEPKGIVVLADGWRALTWSYTDRVGGRLPISDAEACIVDFRAATTTPFDAKLLGERPRELRVSLGPSTGWLYADGFVIDVDNRRATDLPIAVEGDRRVAVAERGTTLRLIGTRYESIDPNHPIFRHRLIVEEFAIDTWPPKRTRVRELVVKGRPDRRVASPDGRWLAHSGQPYYVGRESQGPISDLGLVDLDALTSVFELQRPGVVTIEAVIGDRPNLLQHTTSARGSYSLRWLDQRGIEAGPSVRREIDAFTYDFSWLPAQRQVLVKEDCTLVRIDLPLP